MSQFAAVCWDNADGKARARHRHQHASAGAKILVGGLLMFYALFGDTIRAPSCCSSSSWRWQRGVRGAVEGPSGYSLYTPRTNDAIATIPYAASSGPAGLPAITKGLPWGAPFFRRSVSHSRCHRPRPQGMMARRVGVGRCGKIVPSLTELPTFQIPLQQKDPHSSSQTKGPISLGPTLLAVLQKNQHPRRTVRLEKPLTGSNATRSNLSVEHERAAGRRGYRARPCNLETV